MILHARKFRRVPRPQQKGEEQGFVLLTLLLIVALLIVAALAIIPEAKFQVRRDREEEMIHRGVQYSRAIRGYYKKFGRYPTRLEDLDNTNNLRFLRKHYKDPTNGKDFKLLHFGEAKLSLTGGMGGGGIAGANSVGAMNSANSPGGFGSQGSGLASATGGFSSGGLNSGGSSSGGGFGSSSSSGFGNSSNNATNTASNGTPGQGQDAGTDSSSQSGSSSPSGFSQSGPGQPGQSGGDKLSGQVFGGGPIVGVASINKESGYREFDHKRKYEDWQFVYDPATDRGGLINTPNQPSLQAFGQGPGQAIPGAKPAAQGNGNTDTGQPPAGMQNGDPSLNGAPPPPSPPPNQSN